jgi:outer membrane protein assembly factor BamB
MFFFEKKNQETFNCFVSAYGIQFFPKQFEEGIMRAVWAVVVAALSLGVARAQSVTTYHNSVNRHGDYVVPGLTLAAAATMHLDPAFKASVTGNVYAQPLYWAPTNTLIVATESNTVEALNASTGATVWSTQLAPAAPLSALGCGNVNPEGITGTPVMDPANGTIYLDALVNLSPGGVHHRLYAISVTTGHVLPKWPVDVTAGLAALHQSFDPTVQGERSALLLFGGNLYITYAGRYGDCGNYHGMVVQASRSKPGITAVWATSAVHGGIWAQGGATSDGTSIFATTGNTGGASSWGGGEAIIKLAPGLAFSSAPADFFTPADWLTLDDEDLDLGGTGAIPFNVPQPGGGEAARLLALGKDGRAYLVNRTSLGGIGGEVASAPVSNTVIITGPAVHSTAKATMVAFTNFAGRTCAGESLSMLSITNSTTTPITETWCQELNGAGAPIITTGAGNSDPIVWVTGAQGDNELHGFNALTGAVVFGGGGGADSMSGLQHFSTILAANSHLYVAGSGTVYAFTFTH